MRQDIVKIELHKIIKKEEHKTLDHGWLRTTHHFSFAEYQNPDRVSFGPLRVFNDDTIGPGEGFDFHQHRDMEIVTYVIDGELEHKDNFGNHGIVRPGEVQRMSAGTGVLHSEFNHSNTTPLRLLQMWVFSKKKDLKPSWEQRSFTRDQRRNVLLPVISPGGDTMSINQDASFYISSLESGKSLEHDVAPGRQAYLYVIDGKMEFGGDAIEGGDSAEIEGGKISLTAKGASELILIDVPVVYEQNA
jgi:redox-sensitive bicupin YhaK (pirin superfamily)